MSSATANQKSLQSNLWAFDSGLWRPEKWQNKKRNCDPFGWQSIAENFTFWLRVLHQRINMNRMVHSTGEEYWLHLAIKQIQITKRKWSTGNYGQAIFLNCIRLTSSEIKDSKRIQFQCQNVNQATFDVVILTNFQYGYSAPGCIQTCHTGYPEGSANLWNPQIIRQSTTTNTRKHYLQE